MANNWRRGRGNKASFVVLLFPSYPPTKSLQRKPLVFWYVLGYSCSLDTFLLPCIRPLLYGLPVLNQERLLEVVQQDNHLCHQKGLTIQSYNPHHHQYLIVSWVIFMSNTLLLSPTRLPSGAWGCTGLLYSVFATIRGSRKMINWCRSCIRL